MSEHSDASSAFPWAPVIFATAFALSILAGWIAPFPILPETDREFLRLIGIIIASAGIGVALAAEWRFVLAGTATLPTRPASAVVTDGVYRYTRNPMYLGLSFTLAGVGFMTNSWWFFLAVPCSVMAVTKLAIEREEHYLERKFGADYLVYKAKTRRWL